MRWALNGRGTYGGEISFLRARFLRISRGFGKKEKLLTGFQSSRHEAQLVAIAWECAAGAYEPATQIIHESFVFVQKHLTTPSIGGSRKGATMVTVTEPDGKQSKNPFLPLVVVAIRGSDGKMDHMVNANSEPKNANPFIVCHYTGCLLPSLT